MLAHRPLKLWVRGAKLIFVRSVIAPQTICRLRAKNAFDHTELFGKRKHFGFHKVCDRTEIHPAVAVFRVEPYAEVFDFIARSCHQKTVRLAVVIEGGHAQTSARVG